MSKTEISKKIEELLETIPHLSEEDRSFWLEKIKTLEEKQLVVLKNFLEDEYRKANKALEESLKNDEGAKKADDLKQRLLSLRKKIWNDIEDTEKKADEDELNKLIDQF